MWLIFQEKSFTIVFQKSSNSIRNLVAQCSKNIYSISSNEFLFKGSRRIQTSICTDITIPGLEMNVLTKQHDREVLFLSVARVNSQHVSGPGPPCFRILNFQGNKKIRP